jgi:hypothetical protein
VRNRWSHGMSLYGSIIARLHGGKLTSFSGQAEAEQALFEARDRAVEAILREPKLAGKLDFSVQSLTLLERWFFESGKPEVLTTGGNVSQALGFYLGEVFCRTAAFQWVVEEFAFGPGKYEIGVRRLPLTIMLTSGRRPTRSGNTRMQSLVREYQLYAA